MFPRKRSDTQVGTIEQMDRINLNARSDMLLGNLLEARGFDSETQLIKAYRRQLTVHARRRRVFFTFHHEDRLQVNGHRLMLRNPRVDVDFYDASLRVSIDSRQSPYVKRVPRNRISRASAVLCLIGNGTAWREEVDWDRVGDAQRHLQRAARGLARANAAASVEIDAPVAAWDVTEIIVAIECAAARRS
jgi:antiphage defense system Thoeris ThsB-like protein